MKIHQYREMMRYLTRKPAPKITTQVASSEERVLNREPFYQQPQQFIQDDIARPQVDGIPLYQGVEPNVAIQETMPTYVPPDMSPVMPQAPQAPDPQYRQIELATGGRVNFNEGSKLTGTDKTLEQNIKQDHKAYNDYRKSIGSPTVPLDNEYIRMWIRSRLNSGGPANKQPQKIIPLDLESVAFKLFQDKLDNLSYNQKQTVYDYIEDNRNKKANGGRIGYADGTPMAGLVYVGSWEGPWTGPEFLGGPRKGQYYNSSKNSLTAITGPDGAIPRPGMPITTIQSPQQSETISTPEIPLTVQERYNKYLSATGSGTVDDLYKLYRASVDKKATGGRVNLANGTEEPYNPEISSLGFSDPIDILEQQLINEKDPTKVLALDYQLEKLKKERAAKETEREEFKKSQKEKGIKYKEDFPSEAAYFAETGKQFLTNPKYFLGKGAKGVVEGTEFLIGQPLQTLFSQEGKNFELYQPVGGEKLGINKFIEKNIPKGATTGTLVAGDVAEIAGSIADPFLAYGLVKGAVKGAKPKPPTSTVEDTVDPMRRDILKTSAVMGTGAALYPIAKNINILEDLGKVIPKKAPLVKIIKPLGTTETEFPKWFPSLVSRIRKEGEMTPIYRTEKIPITKEEFMEGIKKTEKVKGEKFYANPRTEEYFRQNPNEFPYYKTKETEDIIGYEYVDKKLPDVKVVEVDGKEASVFFKNHYGAQVEMNYKSPSVMDDGSFYVKDYQPEASSYPDSAPNLEETFVKNIDEVLGGSSQLEKYATKSKTARYTKGESIVDEANARAEAEYDRMKDEGLFDE